MKRGPFARVAMQNRILKGLRRTWKRASTEYGKSMEDSEGQPKQICKEHSRWRTRSDNNRGGAGDHGGLHRGSAHPAQTGRTLGSSVACRYPPSPPATPSGELLAAHRRRESTNHKGFSAWRCTGGAAGPGTPAGRCRRSGARWSRASRSCRRRARESGTGARRRCVR